MIGQIDDALLEKLKNGLSGVISKDDVALGPLPGKKRSVSLACTDFTVDETSVGGSTSVKYEEVVESFDADGAMTTFRLSRPPARAIMSVESPPGTLRKEGDDYLAEPSKGIVSLRAAPKKLKGGVKVKYITPRAIGEVQNVHLALTYAIAVKDGDLRKREDIALEIIRMFYREKHLLIDQGVEDIQVVKGFGNGHEGSPDDELTLVYRVLTTLRVDVITSGTLEQIKLDAIKVK
jgi:hypothetical protein